MPSGPMTDIDLWLLEFPQAWAEPRGIKLTRHGPAIYIELKLGADPGRVRQYPMPLISLTQTGTPLCVTVKKFWHRCTESELISRTSHCRTWTPPGTRTAAVLSEKESELRGQPYHNHGDRDRLGGAIDSLNVGSMGRTDPTGQGTDHGGR